MRLYPIHRLAARISLYRWLCTGGEVALGSRCSSLCSRHRGSHALAGAIDTAARHVLALRFLRRSRGRLDLSGYATNATDSAKAGPDLGKPAVSFEDFAAGFNAGGRAGYQWG